jgi:glycosyltransferase involved in cell wall biosynthesis
MACGLPLVVAAAGGSADVADGAALMARPMDDASFAEHLLALCSDDDQRRQTGAKSLARARAFSWDQTARVTLDALKKVSE